MSPVGSSQKTLKLLQLIEDTGMGIVQRNGQRYYGPRKGASAPPRGCEVFVARLPRDCFEDEIVPVFSQHEPIYEMRLLMDFSGSNRGFAFVTYESPAAAQRVIQQLNGHEIRPGRRIGVVQSLDNCRLYVGGLPRTMTRDELWEAVSARVGGVTDVTMYPCNRDRNLNRGYAFIELSTHRLAALARRRLVNQLKVGGQTLAVDWAVAEQRVAPEQMKRVKVLFVRNLLLESSVDALRALAEQCGGRVQQAKKFHDYAFVHFYTREDAEKALKGLQGQKLDGVELAASWARPVADSRAYRLEKRARSEAKHQDRMMHRMNLNLYEEHMRQSPLGKDETSSGYGSPEPQRSGLFQPLEYVLEPAKLSAICSKNEWGTPEYMFVDVPGGGWAAKVLLSRVGAPLLDPPQHIQYDMPAVPGWNPLFAVSPLCGLNRVY